MGDRRSRESDVVKRLDSYLDTVESTNGDVRVSEEGIGLSFLREYYNAVNGESMRKYFDKVLDGTQDSSILDRIATDRYRKLPDVEQVAVDDMAISFIHYTDNQNTIARNNLRLHAKFSDMVQRLSGHDDRDNKWVNIEDGISDLGREDVNTIIGAMSDIGEYEEDIKDLKDDLIEYGPRLTAVIKDNGGNLVDLYYRLLAAVDGFGELVYILKKFKYINSRAGSARNALEYKDGSRYVGNFGRKSTHRTEASSRRAGSVSVGEIEATTEEILKYYADILPADGFKAFERYITGRDVTSDDILDIYDIIQRNFKSLSNTTAYIKARVFAALNIDDIDLRYALEGLYYLAARDPRAKNFADDVYEFTLEDASKAVIVEDYNFDMMLEYAMVSKDNVPLLLLMAETSGDEIRELTYALFGANRRGDFICTDENIMDYQLKVMPNFNGNFRDDDIAKFITTNTGGTRWSKELLRDVSAIIADVMNRGGK